MLNESIDEDAVLTRFGELGYAVEHGPQPVPGKLSAERDSFGDVVLAWRLYKSGTGSLVTGVSSRNVKPLTLLVPRLVEQTRIMGEVERRLSLVVELEAVVSANLQRATRLRQSILQKAFTGEL